MALKQRLHYKTKMGTNKVCMLPFLQYTAHFSAMAMYAYAQSNSRNPNTPLTMFSSAKTDGHNTYSLLHPSSSSEIVLIRPEI